MKRLFTTIPQTARSILLLSVLAGATASCDSILDYKEGDCSIEYRVKFQYDYNMKKVDAFAQEVKAVTLYAFDESGTFVYQKTEEGDRLSTGDYSMTVDIEPGNYDLVTWAGLDDQSFAVPLLTPGVSKLKDLTVLTRRDIKPSDAGEQYVVQHSLPSLFHGKMNKQAFTRSRQQVVTTIPLIKNTNNIRIVIAQVNQSSDKTVTRAINKNRFSYAIHDDNGFMNYDNSLLKDEMLTYLPFVTEDASITTRAFNDAPTQYPAAIAEISTMRLLKTQHPQLEIIDQETHKELLPNNSLIGYLGLLKEQNFINMSLEEYLDREDHFSMIFFVDENLTMIKSVIQINDWIIQINDFEF